MTNSTATREAGLTFEQHRECLVCGSERLKPKRGYEAHYLSSCQSCGLVFIHRIPTLEELQDHYGTYAYDGDTYLSPITRQRYDELLDQFEPYRKTGRLLDVGCGEGFFLEQARERGWEVYGTEYSDAAISICREKGVTMFQGQLDPTWFEGKEFDVITSFEVIEHINNPREEMDAITNLMRSGGLFYCTTPNFNALTRYWLKAQYNVIGYPEHLTYYTPRTINRLFRDFGLKKKKILTTGVSISRIRTSLGVSDQKYVSAESDDEKLRVKLEGKAHLRLAKSLINTLLTWTGVGINLKTYYEKP